MNRFWNDGVEREIVQEILKGRQWVAMTMRIVNTRKKNNSTVDKEVRERAYSIETKTSWQTERMPIMRNRERECYAGELGGEVQKKWTVQDKWQEETTLSPDLIELFQFPAFPASVDHAHRSDSASGTQARHHFDRTRARQHYFVGQQTHLEQNTQLMTERTMHRHKQRSQR